MGITFDDPDDPAGAVNPLYDAPEFDTVEEAIAWRRRRIAELKQQIAQEGGQPMPQKAWTPGRQPDGSWVIDKSLGSVRGLYDIFDPKRNASPNESAEREGAELPGPLKPPKS
jgi:hypothetical protein